jgi:hypothetical protein
MKNRIRGVDIFDHVLNPAQAEIRITVHAKHRAYSTEIRGRLMGPRCPYAATIEVAYPLRPLPHGAGDDSPLERRVLIPEPNLWDPVSPFLYQGPLELWEEGQLCDQRTIRHGLRTLHLTPRGVFVNGRRFSLRGAECASCSDQEALALREAGHDALLVPLRPACEGTWDVADQFGFLVLGKVSPGDAALAQTLSGHPSCLGWLLDADDAGPSELTAAAVSLMADRPSCSVGLELHRRPNQLPQGIHFLLCQEPLLPALADIPLPKVIRAANERIATEIFQSLLASPGILGWIGDPGIEGIGLSQNEAGR